MEVGDFCFGKQGSPYLITTLQPSKRCMLTVTNEIVLVYTPVWQWAVVNRTRAATAAYRMRGCILDIVCFSWKRPRNGTNKPATQTLLSNYPMAHTQTEPWRFGGEFGRRTLSGSFLPVESRAPAVKIEPGCKPEACTVRKDWRCYAPIGFERWDLVIWNKVVRSPSLGQNKEARHALHTAIVPVWDG